MWKCSCGFENENPHKFSAHFTHAKGNEHKKIGWVDPETGDIFETKPKEGAKAKESTTSGTGTTKVEPKETIQTVGIIGKPIMLDLGSETVPFDRGKMYDSLQLYKDLVTKDILHDDFASFLRDGAGLLWRILANNPVFESEKEIVIV
jgi:hypothetical protein